jgi:hypothetical protein
MADETVDLPLFAGIPFSNRSTSRAAAHAIAHEIPNLEQKVFKALEAAGENGACSHELEAWLGMPHTTVSARIRGLVLRGLVKDGGKKRTTPSGRGAIVWVVA